MERRAEGTDRAARTNRSRHGKSEHLGLDVTIYKAPLGPICFAGEHENTPKIDVLQYASWKLLNVSAEIRVLVGYYSERSSECSDVESVVSGIQKVVRKIPRNLVLILGNRDARPSTDFELKAAFTFRWIAS